MLGRLNVLCVRLGWLLLAPIDIRQRLCMHDHVRRHRLDDRPCLLRIQQIARHVMAGCCWGVTGESDDVTRPRKMTTERSAEETG